MSEELFEGGGEMGELMRSLDWSQTLLGSVETWTQSLRTIVRLVLNSRFPMVIWWGKELVLLYNDAWRPILGTKHPKALGRPGQEVWSEIWDIIGVQLNSVLDTGQATWSDDMLLLVDRYGYTEESFFTYSYSPIFLETGEVGGAFTAVTETTLRVVGERRLKTLRELAASTGETKSVEDICRIASTTLANNPYDISFALLYLVEQDGKQARLVETVRIDAGTPASPEQVNLTQKSDCWKFAQIKQTKNGEIVDELISRFGTLSGGAWDEPSRSAIVLPIAQAGQKQQLAGLLVLGISPRRAFDDEYRGFFDLVASNIATAIANAQAYEAERQRAEALAELDRVKTTFFSNISHEFRTPLTLILSPLEDAIANLDGTIPAQEREQLQLVQRNGMRLLKLVNSLLDFSRIEAGRVQAAYEPVDLATYTAELASTFRSLIEQAGMSLIVDCLPLPEAIYIDREMWEKIVLNLLSNAFKFTLAGTITVRLLWINSHVELSVADTGVGIPSEELPHLFERFHRVKNSQGRSFEGSGIGLSLVQELVKLHGGAIKVSSTFSQGSCFTVTIPAGTAHLPPERIVESHALASTLGAMPYVEEAQRWLPNSGDLSVPFFASASLVLQSKPLEKQAHILLADDNADMRDYIRRLLSGSYTVQTVADGVSALAAIQNNPPDLVLTDVMMPGIDGFELLRWLRNPPKANSLRSDSTTQDIPVILLSARAGEEARIEALEAGANDYLIKPFSARELLARVEASLKLAQVRQEAVQRERAILERVTDAFFALDLDFRFTYANVAAQRVSQAPLEALLGKTIWESFPAIIGTQFEFQYRRSLLQQVAVEFEEYFAPLDLWVEVHVYPSPTGLSLFFRDINDRKSIEATLRASEQRFRDMADNAPMMVWVTDSTGYCTYLSQSWYDFTGQTEESGLGFGWLNATHPDDRQYTERAFLEANERKAVFKVEYRLCRKDGEYIWVFDAANPCFGENGQYKGYIGSIINISDRKQAESTILERSRLSALSGDIGFILIQNDTLPDTLKQCTEMLVRHLDAAFARIWTLNRENNVLELQASAGMYTHLDGSHSQVPVGQFKIGLIAQERQPHVTNNVIGDPRIHDQEWATREGIVAFAGYPLIVENQVVGVIAVFSRHCLSEITLQAIASVANAVSLGIQRKQIALEREQLLKQEQTAREAAEAANRIKDEFLAVLSHELRSPLNPILGWSKLLQQGKLDAAKTTNALATIERNAKLQAQLIDDLLDISRILRGKLSLNVIPTNLSTVISSALETVRLAAESKSLQIKTIFSPDAKTVIGDSARLQQVVWNLLSNAVKFTPQGGQITITLTQTGTHAQLQVTDTGKGIQPDFLPYVFDHFRQEDGATTRKFGGLGLGMAIVRQIVEMHGGTVAVDSPGVGQGATFTVQIPLAPQLNKPPTPEPSSDLTNDLSGIHILVVDDDLDSREFVAFVLEQANAMITSVSSGIEALQSIEQSIPHLVVSDIGMPDMDGYMLMQQVRAMPPEQGGKIPAIALTAYAGEIDHRRALEIGFQRHLSKPLEPNELVQAVLCLLENT